MTALPPPPAEAQALGERLVEQIRGELRECDGALPFSRTLYIEFTLNAPNGV